MIHKERLISNFLVAWEGVNSNKLRSFLTALGIIFGVMAVITMLAIGKGAEKEIISQMDLIGVHNIIIHAKKTQINSSSENNNPTPTKQENISPGLLLADANNILHTVPNVKCVSPEIITNAELIKKGNWDVVKLIGITNSFFEILDLEFANGRKFSIDQIQRGLPVCIIGSDIKGKFIDTENPIGQKIKCNNQWLTIVGVLEKKLISEKAKKQKALGIRNYNLDVYIPIQTMLLRFENRSAIKQDIILSQKDNKNNNLNQLDKITVKIEEGSNLARVEKVISKIIERRHNNVLDYEIVVPEVLLRQQQKTKRIFSVVLAIIAGISLLVGGIGIMNIMLASVLERIKEIGLRIALGAKQSDIIQQFLFEAIIIGISGGLIGTMLGILTAILTQYITGITTVITSFSVVISFVVAVSIGLISGIAPAKKAAKQDPISSLHHE